MGLAKLAGPEREDTLRREIVDRLAPYRAPDGSYQLNNEFATSSPEPDQGWACRCPGEPDGLHASPRPAKFDYVEGCLGHRLARMPAGAAIGLGAVLGLALGIVVSVTTDVPFAPEGGVVLGALVGWLSRRQRP
jgi:hypothetical protein